MAEFFLQHQNYFKRISVKLSLVSTDESANIFRKKKAVPAA
jgi:hypothetical protein